MPRYCGLGKAKDRRELADAGRAHLKKLQNLEAARVRDGLQAPGGTLQLAIHRCS
jgi:hypothetical protein